MKLADKQIQLFIFMSLCSEGGCTPIHSQQPSCITNPLNPTDSPPPPQLRANLFKSNNNRAATVPIDSLPPKLLSTILNNLQSDPNALTKCALVHSSWTIPPPDILYREIRITRVEQAVMLASLDVREFIERTVTVGVDGFKRVKELEMILRACVSLKVLRLEGGLTHVPWDVLQYPSLQSKCLPILVPSYQPKGSYWGSDLRSL